MIYSYAGNIMVKDMTHIYIHDTNSSNMGIGYNNFQGAIFNLFSKTMVG